MDLVMPRELTDLILRDKVLGDGHSLFKVYHEVPPSAGTEKLLVSVWRSEDRSQEYVFKTDT